MTANQAMQRALALAAAVDPAAVTPNPRVGAVLLRDGELIGEGSHQALGGLHAETAAMVDTESRGHSLEGAEMHVTLEPCAHTGRQPPCVEAILAAGIGRVVIASEDPSEKAAGAGPARLEGAGVEVAFTDPEGPDAAMARALNQPFRKHARTGLPHVTLKDATSLDGRIATSSGDSKWISSPESRDLVHRWRAGSDAIAAGIGTVLADDPLLTARGKGVLRQPLRVVFDRGARTPLDSQLVSTVEDSPVLVIAGPDAGEGRVEALRGYDVDVFAAGDLSAALAELGRRGVSSLFVEGGPTLAASFLAAGEVDVMQRFVAPILLGGDRVAASGPPAPTVGDGIRATGLEATGLGPDVLLTAHLREW